jgi:chaperonin GroEL
LEKLIEAESNADEKVGMKIIAKALEIPVRQIAENAGEDGGAILAKIVEATTKHFGFDAATGKFVDMVEAGIIDPKKVTRSALENASSIAGIFLTTEAAIADRPKEEEPAAPAMPGGMGGMGM